MTAPGEYSLADDTYAKLLQQLSGKKFEGTSTELRANILDFYSDPAAPVETRKNEGDWKNVQTELGQLEAMTPNAGTNTDQGRTPITMPCMAIAYLNPSQRASEKECAAQANSTRASSRTIFRRWKLKLRC